jgi:hypothetical protein
MGPKNKRAAKLATDTKTQKVLSGKPIMYIGILGTAFSCPVCNREVIRGILYEENSVNYCSRGCVESVKRSAE